MPKPCCLIAYGLFLGVFALPAVTLDSSVPVVISDGEPEALRKAAADLASDFGKVFGRPIQVLSDPKSASGNAVCIALNAGRPHGLTRPKRGEELEIRVIARPWPGSKVSNCVALTGADVRGAIYAVYEFSSRFLGVDPLWYWTDHTPAAKSRITVPDAFRLNSATWRSNPSASTPSFPASSRIVAASTIQSAPSWRSPS